MNKRITHFLLPFLIAVLLTSCLGLKKEEIAMKEKNLIIQEVFYIGTEDEVVWPSGLKGWTSYSHDTYIRIYNPTNKTLYLDGLCLARSAFQNDVAIDLKGDENFASTHVAVDNLCMFPGSGQDYPIKPGEYKTLTSVAINHTLDVEELYERYKFECSLSYDNGDGTFGTNIDLGNGVKYAKQSSRKACNLEGADFEWLSPQQILYKYQLVDENSVPNMIPLFGSFGYLDQEFLSSAPFGIPTNRSILLLKLGAAPEELDQQKYWWDYETGHPSPMHSQELPYRKAQWSSLDETIATVDDKGRVTPVAVGETEIIATLPNGANDHCTVTVKEN